LWSAIIFAIMFGKSLKARLTIIFLNGRCRVTQDRSPQTPGRTTTPPGALASPADPVRRPRRRSAARPDEFPGAGWRELPPSTQDWLTEEEWVAWLASVRDEDPGLAPAKNPTAGPAPARPQKAVAPARSGITGPGRVRGRCRRPAGVRGSPVPRGGCRGLAGPGRGVRGGAAAGCGSGRRCAARPGRACRRARGPVRRRV